MNSFILAVLAFAGYILAYKTYGRFLANKIFKLSADAKMPAHEFADGIDYVSTKKHIVFGHHFTTIAGLGPIVGPAIGIIWGWLPAFLWVFIGSIFMGAFHDFSTMVISARNKGKTLGDITGDLISPSTRLAFQFLMQFLLLVVLSVFAMIVGVLFEMYPESVLPVWMQIPIAIWLGWQIRMGKNDLLYSIIAVVLMYVSIVAGIYFPISGIPEIMGSQVVTWSIILLIYAFFASTLPVHKLLQPRDYINSHQLLVAMALLIIGLAVAHPAITAPAINPLASAKDTDIPSLMPLLFITIACGAISGFHSLASSGTTIKQVRNEKDTLFIGYGGMIWESFLAVLVILAIAGGLGLGTEINGTLYKGKEAFSHYYSTWLSVSGLASQLNAFIIGASNLFNSFGIPPVFGKSLVAVFIVSFANTTLDSAARIQRLSLQEIFRKQDGTIRKPFDNRYYATFVVVVFAALLAFLKPGATGALILWPLFGAMNQLLAALALAIVTVYLYKNRINVLYSLVPMIFVLVITLWAMINNLMFFIKSGDYLLIVLSVIILLLSGWLLLESILVFSRKLR